MFGSKCSESFDNLSREIVCVLCVLCMIGWFNGLRLISMTYDLIVFEFRFSYYNFDGACVHCLRRSDLVVHLTPHRICDAANAWIRSQSTDYFPFSSSPRNCRGNYLFAFCAVSSYCISIDRISKARTHNDDVISESGKLLQTNIKLNMLGLFIYSFFFSRKI